MFALVVVLGLFHTAMELDSCMAQKFPSKRMALQLIGRLKR